jgi:hypothetical protein
MAADLNETRLQLLSHSKNMVNAARSQDWDAFETLNATWPDLLEQANQNFGSELSDLQPTLLEDNRHIQKTIERAQHTLSEELQGNTKRFHRLQAYLK